MIISIQNNLDKLPETQNSFLSSTIAGGTASLPVRNINAFLTNYAQQIGRTGEEQTEIVNISAASGTALTLYSPTTYPHNIDTPVYQIHYDQIIVKRSTTGTAGTATAIATTNITPDSLFTEYNDSSGATGYAYKTQYFNSVSGDLSTESDWFVPGGPSYYALQKIRQRAKDALYNANYLTDDSVVNDWINEWLEEMTNAAIKVNQAYSIGTALIAFGTAGLGTVTDSLFKQPIKMEVTTDGINYVNSLEIPYNQWSMRDFYSAVYPRHYWLGDTVFGILPLGVAGTCRMAYAVRNTPLVNDSDELPFSLRAYTTSAVNYCLSRAYDKDNKTEQADRFFGKYLAAQKNFVAEITPRDQTGPHTIDFIDSLSGRAEDAWMGNDWVA